MTILQKTILPCLLISLLCCTSSWAHKIRVFAWEEGGEIKTEAKFSGGRPAKNATINVLAGDSDRTLLSGSTDEEGLFSFKPPNAKASAYRIVVDTGDGHRGEWRYEAVPVTVTAAASQPQAEPAPPPEVVQPPQSQLPPASIDTAELEELFARVLDRQLAPIRKQLAANDESAPSLQDILGGIGYLLGLAGIATYFNARKNKESNQ